MRLNPIHNAALSVGAVLGSLCLIVALAGVIFGIKPLMFKSGSMEPVIPTGALALSIPVNAAQIHVGDIVSTENSAGTRITHRVTAVTPADGYAQLTLKGDANDVVDAEIYPITTVDRVFWSVPVLGYAVAWLTSPVALFLGGLLTAYLLYLAFVPRSREHPDVAATTNPSIHPAAGRRARRSGRRRPEHSLCRATGVTVAVTLIVTGGAFAGETPARAQFSDSASAAVTPTAGTLSTPHNPRCELAGGLIGIGEGIVLSWSHGGSPAAGSYLVKVNTNPQGETKDAFVNLPASDAEVFIEAKYKNWVSSRLKVTVTYKAGRLLGVLKGSVSCSATQV